MSLVRHVTPIPPNRAKGRLAEVYRQIDAEYSSAGPAVQMLSPSVEIMAAAWSLMREAQLVGDAPILGKALVAVGVAQSGGTPYEIDGALAVLRLGGAADIAESIMDGGLPDDPEQAALLSWARTLTSPPPSAHTVEYVGTALVTDFLGRVSTAMLPQGLRTGSMVDGDDAPFEGAPILRDVHQHRPEPGASLPLLAGGPEGSPPAWANGGAIGTAYASLSANAAMGAGLLDAAAVDVVTELIAVHCGRRTPDVDPTELLSTLDNPHGAKVAVLAALAPERLTDADVAAWRATDRRFSDHCTVYLLTYGVMTAVNHVADGIA